MGLARWVVLEGRALVVIVNKVDKLREGEWAEEREALGKKMATAVPEEIHAALPQVTGRYGHGCVHLGRSFFVVCRSRMYLLVHFVVFFPPSSCVYPYS